MDSNNAKRSKLISLALTRQEYNWFRGLAAKRHTNLSELIRQLLHREIETSAKGQVA